MTPPQNPSPPARRSWAYFSTPPAVFFGVMGPFTLMMTLLAGLSGIPGWIRISAGIVVAVSLRTLWRGYLCRIEATSTHVRYRTLLSQWELAWIEVRDIGVYIPLDRNLNTRYVYITRRDEPPVDRREIDADTIQLQDRPGLVQVLRDYHRAALRNASQHNDHVPDTSDASAGRQIDRMEHAPLHGGS